MEAAYEENKCSVLLRTKQRCGQEAIAFYDVEPPQLRRNKQKTRRLYLCCEHVHLHRLTREAVYWTNGKLILPGENQLIVL